MQEEPASLQPPTDTRWGHRRLRRLWERLPFDPHPGLAPWRQELFFGIAVCAVLLGLPAYFINSAIAIRSGSGWLAAAFTGIYLGYAGILFIRGLRYRTRAAAALALFYLLAMLSLLTTGLAGSGRMWLLAFTMLAALFLGLRAGLAAIALNLAGLLVLTLLMSTGRLEWLLTEAPSRRIWLTSSMTFFFLNTVVAASLGFFTDRLDRMLDREQALVAELTEANAYQENENRERRQAEARLVRSEANLRAMTLDLEQRAAERKREIEAAHDQLRQIQKMEAIGTLAGGIAHDFNNLLMAVQGYTSLMLFGMPAENPHFKMLQQIQETVADGKRLTQQILGYARLGSYHVKPVDLNRVLRNLMETVGRTRRDIVLSAQMDENLPEVHADEGQIIQVLLNLLINAGEAMPDGGRMEVKTTVAGHADIRGEIYTPRPGRYVKITVADSGIGMDAQTRRRIFEPFFTTKTMGHGAGLGLASAFGIVKAHDGYIEVESEAGRGSAFHVYLPVGGDAPGQPAEAPAASPERKGTVLVVDDENVVLNATVGMLKALGLAAIPAHSGEEAVRIYAERRDPIDLVILDMVMPSMGGTDTFARLRSIDPQVKVLLSSGYSLNARIAEILKRGGSGFLQKPFTLEALADSLETIFSNASETGA
jgi:signal transduction histidine kinase/ActR/RegA family two-component response regulator